MVEPALQTKATGSRVHTLNYGINRRKGKRKNYKQMEQHMKIPRGLGENGASMSRVARAERGSKHEDVSERKQRLIAQKLRNQAVEYCLL